MMTVVASHSPTSGLSNGGFAMSMLSPTAPPPQGTKKKRGESGRPMKKMLGGTTTTTTDELLPRSGGPEEFAGARLPLSSHQLRGTGPSPSASDLSPAEEALPGAEAKVRGAIRHTPFGPGCPVYSSLSRSVPSDANHGGARTSSTEPLTPRSEAHSARRTPSSRICPRSATSKP